MVEYDETDSLVYVRDRNSSNGTFVNDIRIGTGQGLSSGYLLEHGDTIRIHPYWELTFCDKRPQKTHPLTHIQRKETQVCARVRHWRLEQDSFDMSKLFQDRYRITQRCLGQGADGVVYLATETETEKQLVCKLVNLQSVRSKNRREELRRKWQETDVLRQLQHVSAIPMPIMAPGLC